MRHRCSECIATFPSSAAMSKHKIKMHNKKCILIVPKDSTPFSTELVGGYINSIKAERVDAYKLVNGEMHKASVDVNDNITWRSV